MIERFKDIFTGLERAHGVTKVGHSNGNGTKVQGKSFIKRDTVTDELWQNHLQGAESLGIIPINDDNQCQWGCLLYTSPSPRDRTRSRMPSSA